MLRLKEKRRKEIEKLNKEHNKLRHSSNSINNQIPIAP